VGLADRNGLQASWMFNHKTLVVEQGPASTHYTNSDTEGTA